jgi:hypothetical protein
LNEVIVFNDQNRWQRIHNPTSPCARYRTSKGIVPAEMYRSEHKGT